jgi:hypothetical protein
MTEFSYRRADTFLYVMLRECAASRLRRRPRGRFSSLPARRQFGSGSCASAHDDTARGAQRRAQRRAANSLLQGISQGIFEKSGGSAFRKMNHAEAQSRGEG